jgi:hypothetical protein
MLIYPESASWQIVATDFLLADHELAVWAGAENLIPQPTTVQEEKL